MEQLPHNFFVRKKIECPICQNLFTGTTVNPRLYAADSRDSDRHVTKYNWAQEIKTDILPHHYEVWHCPTCFYTALHNEFEQSVPSARCKAAWSSYRRLEPAVQLRIRSLAKLIDTSLPLDAVTVAVLHALALWIHRIVPDEQKDWMDLGRLSLRLAWLYRETPIITAQEDGASPELSDTQTKMKQLAAEIDQSLNQLQSQLNALPPLAEARHREVGQEFYNTLMDSLSQRLNALKISYRTFNQVLLRDLSHQAVGKEKTGPLRPPLSGLCQTIGQFWEQMPRTEAEAVIASVEAFDAGLRLGDSDLSVDAQLNLIITNIRLLEKISDFRRGLTYITDVSKMAFSEKQDLSRKIRESEKAGQAVETRRPLVRQLNSVTAVLQNFSDLRDRLVASLIDQQGEPMEKRLKEAPSRNRQLEILEEFRIPDLAYRFLEEKGWLKKD